MDQNSFPPKPLHLPSFITYPIGQDPGDDAHDPAEDFISDRDSDSFNEAIRNLASDWSFESIGAFPLAHSLTDRTRHLDEKKAIIWNTS